MLAAPAHALDHHALWRGNECTYAAKGVPSGYTALDQHLPGGGWPRGALTELIALTQGVGELRLLMPACARLTLAGQCVAFLDPPYIPYSPALVSAGLDLARLLLVRTRSRKDHLWALEQLLKSGRCGAVLAWPGHLDDRSARRLQLACEQGAGCGFLFAPAAVQASVAALRLSLSASTAGELAVRILKRRGSLVPHAILLDVRCL